MCVCTTYLWEDLNGSTFRSGRSAAGLIQKGFQHVPEPGALEINEDTDIGREAYVAMFGPTVGDRVRLGDTELWIEVESDSVNQAVAVIP